MKTPSVLINSSAEGRSIAYALGKAIQNYATITFWNEGAFHVGSTVSESLNNAADLTDFAVVVLTPGDLQVDSASPNLMFELGYFMGRLGVGKTFVVVPEDGSPLIPTDLAGIVTLRYRPHPNIDVAVAPVSHHLLDVFGRVKPLSEQQDFYSCFISYSAVDKDFSVKLSKDLEDLDFRCWLDAKDIPIGTKWRQHIVRALHDTDKVIVVLSHASARSNWVHLETEKALAIERTRRTPFLIPVRLDDEVFQARSAASEALLQRQIADFRNWQDPASYKDAFSQLVRSLMVSRAIEARGTR